MSVPKDIFPYEYMGGGYFRQRGVPQGQKAEILHGEQAIEFLYTKMHTLGLVAVLEGGRKECPMCLTDCWTKKGE